MKIVKFKNGKYGVRKFGWFGYEYADLEVGSTYWWSPTYVERYAQGSLERAIEVLERRRDKPSNFDKGTPL